MDFWRVLTERVILVFMSQNPNASRVIDAYFQLWQKQVSLLAQSPEKSFEMLVDEGNKIATELELALSSRSGPITEEDISDASDPS